MNRYSIGMLILAASMFAGTRQANAEIFGGIDFPDGARSFADEVIRVDPLFRGGPVATDPTTLNPGATLQAPQGGAADFISYSLSEGGLIELAFLNNLLTNSGDSEFDLHVFEVGNLIEATFVSIRPTPATKLLLDAMIGPWTNLDAAGGSPAADMIGDGFLYVGYAGGSTTSIDIDPLFPGFDPSQLRFDAVQLIDDETQTFPNAKVGADIDAVGAIASVEVRIPEASSMLVWTVAVAFGFGTRFSRRRKKARK
ncbi:MAG: hypothetical protein KDA42_18875 [Planctomycetales bacterium]|nr:hypothetical protein [Planctomycetales bacterium]